MAAAAEAGVKRQRASAASIGQHDLASGGASWDAPGADGAARVPLPDRADRRHAHWERQVHAVLGVLGRKQLMTVDEMRRCIEGLEPEVYRGASYYEKWAVAIATVCCERGVLSNEALDAALGPAEDPPAAGPFAAGAVVRVRAASHATRWRRPHLRTPGYVHGVVGVVARCVGSFPNPEKRAFGGGTRGKQPLYIVRFDWRTVNDHYDTDDDGAADAVEVEVYHSWLEPAGDEDLRKQRERASGGGHSHGDGHAHAHGHGRDCGDHSHEPRAVVEQKAVDTEIPCPPIADALVAALRAAGAVSAEELRVAIEAVDAHDEKRGAAGRRVVARAWADAEFKQRLLADANAACAEMGIVASNATAPTQLVVTECTEREHHLLVCTLCSCYPLALLGLSPDWYKSREYRSRAVRQPRALLREFGTELQPGERVTVHDSTADCRYLVLPVRPEGTDGWSEERLQEVVTRDAMIGVTKLPPQC